MYTLRNVIWFLIGKIVLSRIHRADAVRFSDPRDNFFIVSDSLPFRPAFTVSPTIANPCLLDEPSILCTVSFTTESKTLDFTVLFNVKSPANAGDVFTS